MLQGKKILIGVTGSIAAYKIPLLVRMLVREGAEVKVVMTTAATDFVTALTLSTVSRQPVISELFSEGSWSNHVQLGRWADLMLIAPLSCNTLAKMSAGLCDNMLMATYLSATCPVAVAPAMDEDMWLHAATKHNLSLLSARGHTIIPVEHGELASGLTGPGRMAEPEVLFQFITGFFRKKLALSGKTVLVTAGPTYEPLDPVRFIGNHSSGKMGIALAEELASRGASVQLILGPVSSDIHHPGIHITRVQTAEEMYEASIAAFKNADVAVMAAAVADYSPVNTSKEKIKKNDSLLQLELAKTKDILKTLGELKYNGQLVVGFALETQNEKNNALEKLKNKNADLIVLNSLNDEGAGFGHDTNKVSLFAKGGDEQHFERKPKREVAIDIVDRIVNMLHG